MTGPLPASMSKGIPMPVRGVRISENRITPSGLKARQGCREISTCRGPTLLAVLLREDLAGEGEGLDTECGGWLSQAACEQCSVQISSALLPGLQSAWTVSCQRRAAQCSVVQCSAEQSGAVQCRTHSSIALLPACDKTHRQVCVFRPFSECWVLFAQILVYLHAKSLHQRPNMDV